MSRLQSPLFPARCELGRRCWSLRRTLQLARTFPDATARDLAERRGISPRTIRRQLRVLRKAGLLYSEAKHDLV